MFTGARQDVPDVMNAMDVVVHTSVRGEPFGRVIIEAMSVGRPVVATRAGGVPEFVHDGVDGMLVAPGDSGELAAVIERLLRDPALRARLAAGASAAVRNFSLDHHVAEMTRLYDRILLDRGRGRDAGHDGGAAHARGTHVSAAQSGKISKGTLKLVADVSGTFGTRLITVGFALVTGIVTARALGPENRGVFALVSMFPASLVTLAKLGQGISAVYFIRRENEDVRAVASNLVLIALLTAIVLVATTLLLSPLLLKSILRGVPLWALLTTLPLIPTLLLESHLYGVLQATDRFRVYNTRLLAEAIITMTGMTLALVVFHLGLPGALGVAIGVRLCMTLWVVWTIHRETPLSFHFDWPLFQRMIRYGLKSHMQTIASHFHFKADIYLVAYFLAPAEVAFYSIAARLAEHLLWFPQALGMALFPRLAGSDVEAAHRLTAAAVRQTLVASAVPALILAALAPYLVTTWYGADYAPAVAPLRWVCVGIVMMSLYVLLTRNFTSRNRQGVNIFAAYLALGGNLALNVVMIPRFGIEGAAMATACSYSAATLVLLVMFLRESGLSATDVLVIKRSDVAVWWRLASALWSDLRPAKA